ncbi:MAG: hypothetical protein AAGE59_29390 [Cyanobacteria bacterium P01_F01_bin.86]
MTDSKNQLRDRLILVGTGIVCAVLAALFWRWAGMHGFTILLAMSMVAQGFDNFRLRQQVKRLKQRVKGLTPDIEE